MRLRIMGRVRETSLKRYSDNDVAKRKQMSMNVDMRTPHNIIQDMRERPSELVEKATPWVMAILGAGMVGIMAYSWLAAWWPK